MTVSKPDEFDPVEHSVYLGRERLGRYSRAGKNLYRAFDAGDRLLGDFGRPCEAYKAVSAAMREAALPIRNASKGADVGALQEPQN